VTRPTVVLELAADPRLARDLAAGGVFVPACTLALNEDCELVVRGSGGELAVAARVVWVDGARGVGLQLVGVDAELKRKIAELAAPEPAAEPAPEPEAAGEAEAAAEAGDAEERKAPASMHERLRGLTLVQQVKIATHGEIQERILLERLYGKNVWEALLRNPRITSPEVARIARMGSLPRTMVEIIVGNGAWLQIPEVRRALLTNPRLGTDQVMRVLRLLPKHELKLAAMQTAYPTAVRMAAKTLMRDGS
jgi:hypothetical protein